MKLNDSTYELTQLFSLLNLSFLPDLTYFQIDVLLQVPNIDDEPYVISDTLIFYLEKEESNYVRYVCKDKKGNKVNEVYVAYGAKKYI